MATLIALYNKPSDVAAFDKYYYSTHATLAKKIKGLRRYEVSTGPVNTPQGDSRYHLVAMLTFDSLGAIQQALSSPEGQATAADLANFAHDAVELLVFDTKDA